MSDVPPATSDVSLRPLFHASPRLADGGELPKLPGSWLQKSDLRGLEAVARVLGVLLLLLGAAPWLVIRVSPWTLLALAPLIGAYTHKLTIVMHECCHAHLFASRAWNERVGRFCGYFVGSEFRAYTQNHMQHHQHNGSVDDPEILVVAQLHGQSRGQLTLYLVRPLLGLGVVGIYRGSPGRARHPRPAGDARAVPGGGRIGLLLSILVVQLGIAFLATGGGRVPALALLYPLSTVTLALFFSRLRGFCEHLAPREWADGRFTRTHAPNLFDNALFYDTGMNYHLEHHLYPKVPRHQLPRVHRLLCDGYHTSDTLSCSILGTVFRRLAEAPR